MLKLLLKLWALPLLKLLRRERLPDAQVGEKLMNVWAVLLSTLWAGLVLKLPVGLGDKLWAGLLP